MMKKLLFFIALFFSYNFYSSAQDAQISMFTTSRLNLNPAATGYFQNECMRADVNYRNQWASMLSNGISTYGFSFDKPERKLKMGWGLVFSNTSAGKGALSDMSAMASFSYNTKLSKKSGTNLAFGLQAGIKQKSFNPSDLSFGNQYDGPNVGFNSSKTNGEIFSSTAKIFPDFNFGTLLYVKNQWRKFQPWVGVAAYHLFEPNESLISSSSTSSVGVKLPRKYVGWVGSKITISKSLLFDPIILFQMQGNQSQGQFGAMFEFLSPKDLNAITLQLGTFYRTSDAIVAMVGLGFSNFLLTFDYEINTSALHAATNYMGGPEISLRYQQKCKGHNVKFM